MSRVYVADDKKGVTDKVTSLFEEALTKPRTGAEGFFTVGLSGGSAVAITIHVLKQLRIDDFQKWRFFFCDERVVPFDHPESTFGAFRSLITSVPGLSEAFFVPINPVLPLEDCERDYTLRLKQFFPGRKLPDLDVCVLGMGPDGHTCSLFPHHDLLAESKRWVAAIADSPKPPLQRVTFTLPVLNAAKNVIFIVTGESKAAALRAILSGLPDNPALPASLVHPNPGVLHWVCDKPAAAAYMKELL
ncbi:6-phosphogluconolactonase-like [Varroa jacobsoni]|uniref:6-phosphogluconolactonase n=1 Tax=Varroa destructor TaxID=109461 RepID=A0A7M7K4C8_VARDE|nr:6-phosphogluconolactonase-like [Varroa destructor]XP_022661459.1 6-phosphogluconolactonase-like [Varroa destructor]XP_022661460.1 6-phosphogluconolactonase-like [Varroa destructor]XP_022661461.1 6-phosphogluconolactonase-like [Varroa destructor]XP_022661462.1 6-phosphogluconolactonase-like [Varroa destructor]XP_022661463.1 6-phosphogluconolactonase-like [Varroa destructor]XP_022709570.1 6-phosphogluconolactonase-like [Varroa jacobsoni]XP_022709571.1 6-phosphogluconolactonase-like [Varroa 